MEYNKSITDKFLIRYKELENLQDNEQDKYEYLLSKYKSELDMFRHMRNDLSHNVINGEYPFVVAYDCLELLEHMLDQVKEKAISVAKLRSSIILVKKENKMKEVIHLMSKYHYSFLPIVNDEDQVIGLISSDSVLDIIADKEKLHYSDDDTVLKYMPYFDIDNNVNEFYLFIDRFKYLYEVQEMISNYNHARRKLGIIFITQNGHRNEKLVGILTPWDLIKNQD